MKHVLRIPTQEQYAYVESEFEGTVEEALAEYTRITNLVKAKPSSFKKIETFTGETILYDAVNHRYTDLDGRTLIGGSTYKASLETPFDLDRIAGATAKKYEINEDDIRDMWKRNGEISSGFGTALHAAMEQWFRHRLHGTERNYHLPKHPLIRQIVETFPLKDCSAIPEVFVSDVKNRRVGQIDLLVQDGDKEKEGFIIDYKSDAEVEKNVSGHFNQLSYYAHILMAHGWTIHELQVWNYTDKWTRYTSQVLDLKVKK